MDHKIGGAWRVLFFFNFVFLYDDADTCNINSNNNKNMVGKMTRQLR